MGIDLTQEPKDFGFDKKPSVNLLEEQEGHWQGWVRPSIRQTAEGVKATPATALALFKGVAAWPVSKLFGVGKLVGGGTAEEAKQIENDAAQYFGFEPESDVAKDAVNVVGQVIETGLKPAKMAGDEAARLGYPKTGYLLELASELAIFKMAGKIKTQGQVVLAQRASAKSAFDAKFNNLTKVQKQVVEQIAKDSIEPKSLVKEEKKNTKQPLEDAYEVQKDLWIGEKDYRMHEANIESSFLKKEIRHPVENRKISSKKARVIDEAIQVYIDLKEDPTAIERTWERLSEEQRAIVDLARNLPPEAQAVADKISKSYEDIGLEAYESGVIKNIRDNYTSRTWDLSGKRSGEVNRKFGTYTRHSKQRTLLTILDGWAEGYNLKVKGATENLRLYKHEVIKTLEDRRFLKTLRETKTLKGEPFISSKQLQGYARIDHPNFKSWEWAGEVDLKEAKFDPVSLEMETPVKDYGKNFFVDEKGTLYERRSLYAPKRVAKNLNNMLGISELLKIPGLKAITKLNDLAKAWILQSSFFHHFAFMRSYYLPGLSRKKFAELGFRSAYKAGLKSIALKDPQLEMGIRRGLTIGLRQDWSEPLLREKTWIGKMADQHKVPKRIKNAVTGFREAQADFLFGELGAGLKAKAFLIEFRDQLKRYPNQDPKFIASRVARLINDDFGGLHLQRIGRNPTLQHIFRLFALAPDWTESNVRTMLKTLKNRTGDAAEITMYRKFWGGVVVKGLGTTVLANFALAGGDINELIRNYKTAWKSKNLKWAMLDITPVYKAFGGEDPRRKYLSFIGHFVDPTKFVTHPIRSAQHKGSVIYRFGHEALKGTDWRGRPFTTYKELMSKKQLTKWGSSGPIDWEQFPAYAMSQIIGTQPIQVQNFIGWMGGETAGWDALARSIGLRTASSKKIKSKLTKGIK